MVHEHSSTFETTDFDEFMHQLETYIAWDMYDDTYHKVTYINNAVGESQYMYKASKIAKGLVDSKNFTNAFGAAEAFYLYTGNMSEMFNALHQAIWQKAADRDSWNNVFEMLRNKALPALNPDFMPAFLDGLVELRDYYLSYNDGRLQQIELTEGNEAFMNASLEAFKSDMDAEGVYAFLMMYSDAKPAEESAS